MPIALADLLDKKQIALDLQARDQTDAVRELVQLLADNGKIRSTAKLATQVQKREKTNSTYAGDGVAFPHARTDITEQILLAVGRSKTGIAWTGKGERAHLMFLIAIPQKLISDYLVVVGAIARVTKDEPLRTLLLHAENVDEFIATMLAAPTI
jgi:mannitol/fructose-specific phosphotransferase system IIA component (Ntr-type)